MTSRWMTGALAGVMLLGGVAMAQQRGRLPAECRRELVRLCSGASEGFRTCTLSATARLSSPCRQAITDRTSGSRPLPQAFKEERYGSDPKQTLAYARPAWDGPAPLFVFVHGGGWSIGDKSMSIGDKSSFALCHGWAFATLNYRLVPHATVEQQAADIANALAWLRAHAAERGFDKDRIVLMGHSAGAHLAALVGTDPRYFKAAGVPMAAVKGIVLLDGAGYDVPAQINAKNNSVKSMYDAAFGKDPARQRRLSPTLQAAPPNVDSWLILPIERRADSQAQSAALAAALSRSGATVSVKAVPGESHRSLNQGLGESGDFATRLVETFLRSVR